MECFVAQRSLPCLDTPLLFGGADFFIIIFMIVIFMIWTHRPFAGQKILDVWIHYVCQESKPDEIFRQQQDVHGMCIICNETPGND